MRYCPRDRSRLGPLDLGGVRVSACGTCDGFAVTLDEVVALAKRTRAAPGRPPSPSAPRRPPIADEIGMRCTCELGPPTRAFRGEAVRIDYCPACRHLWLDPGEAHALHGMLEGPEGLLAVAAQGRRSVRADAVAATAGLGTRTSGDDGLDALRVIEVILDILASIPYIP